MRRVLCSLSVLAVLAAPALAGDCNKSRGRVIHSRRVQHSAPATVRRHAPAPTQSGHETIVSSNPVIVHETTSTPAVTTVAPTIAKPAATPDIVDTAVAAGQFKTLAAALGAADLVGTLKGDGPFTVFAPTDDAFAKLPAGTVETLLKPENKDKLREILLLHVVPGKVAAADVVKIAEAKTAGGGTLAVDTTDGVKLRTPSGSATVIKTDIPAKNGLIHVIDSVLLP